MKDEKNSTHFETNFVNIMTRLLRFEAISRRTSVNKVSDLIKRGFTVNRVTKSVKFQRNQMSLFFINLESIVEF